MSAHDSREQYFLELVNRARMNPLAEAQRFGINLNDGLASGTISSAPKQVLAGNSLLNNAATGHSLHMLDVDRFEHSGIGDGTLGSRIADAGYVYNFAGENIAWNGSTGGFDPDKAIGAHHEMLFKSAGHRTNILSSNFDEIGIGAAAGVFRNDGTNFNGLMSTQNFGQPASGAFVTGVAYQDLTGDKFYSIGEGLGSIDVKLTKSGSQLVSTSTASAGGYAAKTTTTGSMELVFSDASLPVDVGARFTLSSTNVKIDLVGDYAIELNASATLIEGTRNAKLLGIESKSLYGNAYANKLEGNAGTNTLNGSAGNDMLIGRKGADKLTGGSGADKFHFSGVTEAGDSVTDFANGDHFCFSASGFGGLAKGDLSASAFRLGSKALDSNDRFVFNSANDTLYFDSNGSGSGGVITIAKLTNGFTLDHGDILIV
jgi:serralysin